MCECVQIAVGAKFKASSSLRVLNPARLARSASYTQLSMHFKTEHSDGLLLFLGNEKDTARNTRKVGAKQCWK